MGLEFPTERPEATWPITSLRGKEVRRPMRQRRPTGLYAPLVASVSYLGGTFILFVLIGQVDLVPDMPKLVAFVVGTLVSLSIGYRVAVHSRARWRTEPVVGPISIPDIRRANRWVLVCGIYFGVLGGALLLAYGASSPGDVIQAILQPGRAYLAKFAVYDAQNASGVANPVLQILTLASGLYTALVPLFVVYGRRIRSGVRLIALGGVVIYSAFFLFIGTLKGLADLAIFAVFSLAAVVFGSWPQRSAAKITRRQFTAMLILLSTIFIGYMAYNQAGRLAAVGISDRFEPNPLIEQVVGEDLARGVAVVGFYPTHGYLGLAYNLETPFVWAQGLGASRALDSYASQYLDTPSAYPLTYPARTEARTGWPALRYWSTGYTWFASDLTFPGTIALMAFVGWALGRLWIEAAYQRSILALLIFVQVGLEIVYLPANNQIGTGRNSLIAFSTIVSLYIANRVAKRLASR